MGNLKSKQVIIATVFVFFMLTFMLAAILASKQSTERRSRASAPTSTPVPLFTSTPVPFFTSTPVPPPATPTPPCTACSQIETVFTAFDSPAYTTAYVPLIVRNWPGTSGTLQWTDIMFANPNTSQATITINVYSAYNGAGKTNGQLLATLTKTAPAYGWYNTYADADWLNLPDNNSSTGVQTLAWAKITSSVPIAAMSRWKLTQGGVYNSPFIQLKDERLIAVESSTYQNAYTPLVVRNWPSGITGQTQWTELYFSNPDAQQATVTINVYSAYTGGNYTNGQLMAIINLTVPANGWASTFGNSAWMNLPDNYPAWSGAQTLAWAYITSSRSIVGSNQWTIRPRQ